MDEKKRLDKNKKPPVPTRTEWNKQIYILRIFDQLIANKDRNLDNIITKNWDVWMIDHPRPFHMYRELCDAGNLLKCDRALLKAMRGLNKETLKKNLGKYLTEMEIDRRAIPQGILD
jgi:hypothetical protein